MGSGFLFGGLTFLYNPTLVEAKPEPEDYIVGETNAIRPFTNQTEAIFSPLDRTRQQFYASQTKRLDTKAGNRLYKHSDHGFEYWTPIRPRVVNSGGVSNGEYVYENFYTAKMYGNDKHLKSWIGDLWVANPKITRNFKTVQMRKDAPKGVKMTKADLRTLGKFVERSPDINNGGNFKGKSGDWRFTGYASDGSSLASPIFPPDYTASRIRDLNWDNYATIGNRFFNVSTYNTAPYRSAKRELIKRYRAQNPEFQYKSVDQWMSILSLQTEPQINPATGKADGKYGGASFSAYHSKGEFYRSFSLYNNDKVGNKNLGNMKLVITENEKVNGSYPVVATISRSKLETRNFSGKKVSGKLVPGKEYRVVTTVRNGSKTSATKLKPTSVDIGYSTNYNGKKIETDGVYNPNYDNGSAVATRAGNIGKGGSVTVTGKLKIANNAKAGSKIRIGSIISDKHRTQGDNLNYVDDDLMVDIPVETGNMKATNVVLVDSNGKEVANPIPGKQYKLRYKFKYEGPTQKTQTKVTVNYQNTRKLPDGSTEAIQYQNGSKTKTDVSNSKNIRLVKNKSYYIDSKSLQWYQLPYIKTTASLSSDAAGLNVNTKDDTYSKTWNQEYDMSVGNVQVVSRTERGDTSPIGKQYYAVSFTVNNKMPNTAKNDYFAQNVNIRVNLGGQQKIVTEHIKPGENKDIVVEFALNNPVKKGSTLNAKVDVNFDRTAYENGKSVYSNNSATTKVTTANFRRDPVTGAVVNPTNNGSNTGAYVAHQVDPNKMTKVTKDNNANNWSKTYEMNSYNGTKRTYLGLNGRKSYTFYDYRQTGITNHRVQESERYNIQDVLMRSKVTSDNRWGEKGDGWVSMLNDPGRAQIKAGYGYELKLVVSYSASLYPAELVENIGAQRGVTVRPKNPLPNLTKDVYFQTSDSKILSASGINNTNKVFVPRDINRSGYSSTVEYTLQDSYSLGVRTPGRIYVSEDTANGIYNVRAWTPEINGIATKNYTRRTDSTGTHTLYTPEPLVDIHGSTVSSQPQPLPTKGRDSNGNIIIDTSRIPSMSIVVVGSDKDDLVDSIVQ